jgi:hypothetical protein
MGKSATAGQAGFADFNTRFTGQWRAALALRPGRPGSGWHLRLVRAAETRSSLASWPGTRSRTRALASKLRPERFYPLSRFLQHSESESQDSKFPP